MTEITSTSEIAEEEWNRDEEPQDVGSNIVATTEPERRGIEFHVSMRDYTQRDMEGLIIEAAARLIVGRQSATAMAKAIEAKCIELVNAKATAKLETITAEIIDQPVTPQWAADKKPVTMREMLGLYGRAYLMEMVGPDGKTDSDHWSRTKQARIVHLVEKAMDAKFKTEIEKSTHAVVNEIRAAIKASHEAMLAAEKARFMEALAKVSA